MSRILYNDLFITSTNFVSFNSVSTFLDFFFPYHRFLSFFFAVFSFFCPFSTPLLLFCYWWIYLLSWWSLINVKIRSKYHWYSLDNWYLSFLQYVIVKLFSTYSSTFYSVPCHVSCKVLYSNYFETHETWLVFESQLNQDARNPTWSRISISFPISWWIKHSTSCIILDLMNLFPLIINNESQKSRHMSIL